MTAPQEARMTTLQEAARKALKALEVATTPLAKDRQEVLTAMCDLRTALAQQGEPVAWTHSCNALCTDGLELWIDQCPHCGKPRTAHAEQWPPGLITDIVLTVTALHKEVDIGWSPDARSHLSRLSTSIGMLAAAPAPVAQQGEQQSVCYGCGIPAGDVHMSTCKSGKWPSRVSNGDTAAPAPQAQQVEPVAQARLGMKDGLAMALSVVELYGMKGDVIYREIAKLRDGIAAAPAPQPEQEPRHTIPR